MRVITRDIPELNDLPLGTVCVVQWNPYNGHWSNKIDAIRLDTGGWSMTGTVNQYNEERKFTILAAFLED